MTATDTETPWVAVRQAATRAGILAVFALGIAAAAHFGLARELRTTAALAPAVGCGGALVANMARHPRLAALWADLTAWIATAFLIASTWNAIWLGAALHGGIDLGLGAALVCAAFPIARAARRAAAR